MIFRERQHLFAFRSHKYIFYSTFWRLSLLQIFIIFLEGPFTVETDKKLTNFAKKITPLEAWNPSSWVPSSSPSTNYWTSPLSENKEEGAVKTLT